MMENIYEQETWDEIVDIQSQILKLIQDNPEACYLLGKQMGLLEKIKEYLMILPISYVPQSSKELLKEGE